MSNEEASQAQYIQEVGDYVAQQLAKGQKRDKVVKELIEQGWAQETAKDFVVDLEVQLEAYKRSPEGREVMASKHKRHMLHGLLWLVGGLAVTLATYHAAGPGGVFFVAWGAVLFGAIDVLRGFIGWLKWRG